jgi:hypothetical protein
LPPPHGPLHRMFDGVSILEIPPVLGDPGP